MKLITPFFALLLALSYNAVLAEEKSASDDSNLFTAPLIIRGETTLLSDEDLLSPFAEMHFHEQDVYARLYYGHYHGIYPVYPDKVPFTGELPSPVDAQGRPLWFDGPHGSLSLRTLVLDLLSRSQIEDLDRLLNDWDKSSERLADGRWKLVLFENALLRNWSNVVDWEAEYQPIKDLKQRYPKSPSVAFTEAAYWIEYAWNARGSGYTKSVTPEGWKLFHERLKRAESVLIDSQSYTSGSPLWGRLYMEVGNDLGWPKERILTLFLEEVSKHIDFEPIYFSTAGFLTPKWGGSWELLDAFVRDATKMTKEFDGASIYAYIYWGLVQDGGDNIDLFRDTHANWAEVKRGFQDLVKLYPHSAKDLNEFAAAACAADDKETYQAIRFKIGKIVIRDVWQPNYSPDLCDHKFKTPNL